MDSDEDSARNLLERILIDENAEPTQLPLSLLKSITNCFSGELLIGIGGFGVVYKGLLQNGSVVAVKMLTQTLDMQHEAKFHQEVDSLMRVKHRNIVRFLGYCSETKGIVWKLNGKKNVMAEERHWFLCLEYLPQGSLDKYMADAAEKLGWLGCYQIIKGVCKGLHYLHQQKIVHLDLKPANILLDQYMLPKITDFGLSRCFDENQTHVITKNVFGSRGYMAPEFRDGMITYKSDIYSLGIIIIEILTGQKECPDTENVLESLSIKFAGNQHLELVRVCAEIGIECADFDPAKRPDTQRILERLDGMESRCGVTIIDDPSKPWGTHAPSPLQRITSRELVGPAVSSTEIPLDVHPLELQFPPWKPEQKNTIPVTFTNWTDHKVAVWITPTNNGTWNNFCHSCWDDYFMQDEYRSKVLGSDDSIFTMMEPRSTKAILMTMGRPSYRDREKPPSWEETTTFEVVMVLYHDELLMTSLKQSIGSRLNMDGDLLNSLEASGDGVHRVMLKASISNPAESCQAAMTPTFIPVLRPSKAKHSIIKSIDVHPTEPWVLVVSGDKSDHKNNSDVSVLNYLTQKTLTTLDFDSKIHVAKFIPQEQWFVIGGSDGYVTVYSYSTRNNTVIKRFVADEGQNKGGVVMLTVHPTYPFMLTSTANSTQIKLWDWAQGWICTRTYLCLTPRSIFWNPLNTDTFTCISISSLKVCEIRSSDPCTTFFFLDENRPSTIESSACLFSAGDSHHNSMIIITLSLQTDFLKFTIERGSDTETRIWDIGKKECVHKLFAFGQTVRDVACHPTLPILATCNRKFGYNNYIVCVWDARTYRLEKTYELTDVPVPNCMIFTPTTHIPIRLVVGCENDVIVLEIDWPTLRSA